MLDSLSRHIFGKSFVSLQLLAAAMRAMASLASQQPAHCAALVAAGPGLDAILSVLRSTDSTHDDWGNAALVVGCVACSPAALVGLRAQDTVAPLVGALLCHSIMEAVVSASASVSLELSSCVGSKRACFVRHT